MSEQQPLCSASLYKGILLMTICVDDETRVVVIGTANRQAIQLYQCADLDEARALVDAALELRAVNLPEGLGGGARAVECVAGSMQPV